MGSLAVIVRGQPAPQGSKTRLPNGAMRESSRAVAPWREAVRAETAATLERVGGYTAPKAATVWLTFTVRRPGTHYGTGRNALSLKANAPAHPRGRPDLDKLVRATLDALTNAGALVDDANVVRLLAVKCYPGGDLDALDVPGVCILITDTTN